MDNYQANLAQWMEAAIPEQIKAEITSWTEADKYEAFYKEVQFGTAGIRGVRGWGTNRLNLYNIRMYSLAYGQYLLENSNVLQTGVIIAYDNRHFSKEFSLVSAEVFGALGIKTYLFKNERPTPQLSWAIRYKKLAGGLVLTASHNPPEYNGYKIYDDTGCQIAQAKFTKFLAILRKNGPNFTIPFLDRSQLEKQGLLEYVEQELDQAYLKDLAKIPLNPITNQTITIAYSPQHGAAGIITEAMFQKFNIKIHPVAKQSQVDPDFTNAPFPNPEDDKAYHLLKKLGKEIKADLLISTDPDGDRIGIGVWHHSQYHLLNGNQTAAILLTYLLQQKQLTNSLKANSYIINTNVTSTLGARICAKYGVKTHVTLTGFKWIGSVYNQMLEGGNANFLCGYEESYGFLLSDIGRDKDSLQAGLFLAEICQFYQNHGQTLVDVLEEIYQEFGFYQEFTQALVLKGPKGAKQIATIVNYLTTLTGAKVLDHFVTGFTNYHQQITYLEQGQTEPVALPKHFAFKFHFGDDWATIRPSGTEPKLKIYYCLYAPTKKLLAQKYQKIKSYMENIVQKREM